MVRSWPPDRDTEQLYLAVVEHLAALGFAQYEVANFARPGAESRHNRNYWRHRPWLGLGPGRPRLLGSAAVRATIDSMADWLADLDAGPPAGGGGRSPGPGQPGVWNG